MKQSVFNLWHQLKLLWTFTVFSYQTETFDRTNNWANIISTTFYILSQTIFITVIFANVTTIASYTRSEMLFFVFLAQLGYYLSWLIQGNLKDLVDFVNTGRLDNLLLRPTSALFYVTFRKIRLFSTLRDAIAPTVFMILVINWPSLHLQLETLIIGIVILVLGQICVHCLFFLAVLLVFWLGESSTIFSLVADVDYLIGKTIPLEGFATNLRLVLTTLVPILISAGVSTSVILGKTLPYPALLSAIGVTILALVVRQYAWNLAIRAYSSASS